MALLVNGEGVEDDAIREEAERMRPAFEEAFRDEPPDARAAKLLEWARENIIEKTLLVQEARRDPRPIPAQDIEAALDDMKRQLGGEDAFYRQLGLTPANEAEVRGSIELRLRVDRLLRAACGSLPRPSDEAVECYYGEHADEFTAPEQVRAAHIVKHVDIGTGPAAARAALAEVREQLERGADFGEMARAHSDCPENDGDLGYFARGQMVEEFEDRVFAMAVGQMSEVFPSRFGFHIVKLLDRRPPAPYSLDQAREQVEARLLDEARNAAIERYLDELRARASVQEA